MTSILVVTAEENNLFVDGENKSLFFGADEKVLVLSQDAGLTLEQQVVRTLVLQAGGPPGPPGAEGQPGETEGATFLATAGETIHGLRAVRIDGDQIFHPDISIPAHAPQTIGIATQSGSIGASLLVRTGGLFTEPSWTWGPGFVWCGADGVLTQAPGATGWLLAIGRAKDQTTINVDIDTPFIRSS